LYTNLNRDYLEEKRECLGLVMLDIKKNIIDEEVISIGTLDQAIVHPRDVFRPSIRNSSHSIILVHNHPSGDVSPSNEDIMLTNSIFDAGKLLGIPLLDFIIVGDGFNSLKEAGSTRL